MGNGSINGVNINHYSRENVHFDVRTSLNISKHNTVFVYVGRLVPDKGIVELIEAFVELADYHFDVDLLLVGEQEEKLTPLPIRTREKMARTDRIHAIGWHLDVRPYLAAANVFVLPSYREGLPNSVIEAGAMSLPWIVTDINGCNEVITEGVNGKLVPVKDSRKLLEAMEVLRENSKEVEVMGNMARFRVIDSFDQEVFWIQLADYYMSEVLQRR
jgi:glycosyltransferase involved in cell wall biosynthesis